MAGVFRGSEMRLNSSLGYHCVDLANFKCSQTSSLVSHLKFAKNPTSATSNTRIFGKRRELNLI